MGCFYESQYYRDYIIVKFIKRNKQKIAFDEFMLSNNIKHRIEVVV